MIKIGQRREKICPGQVISVRQTDHYRVPPQWGPNKGQYYGNELTLQLKNTG